MKNFVDTCFRRSCAENFDRLSLEIDVDVMGFPDPIPPESRSSCSIIAGTKNKKKLILFLIDEIILLIIGNNFALILLRISSYK
jgi:hypothetical protein